jgi:hypothetical protein
MPETRVERAVFVFGLVAIGALAVLVVYYRHSHRVSAPASRTSSTPALSAKQPYVKTASSARAATTAPTVTSLPGTVSTTTAVAPTTSRIAPRGKTSVVLTASRDTWLEVRSGSSTGTLLYSGILVSGASKAFHAAAVWTRFGSGGNLEARVDGRRLSLPRGTYDALFSANGFQQVRG